MLYHAILAVNLPCSVGSPLPSPFWEGVERLLHTGVWSRRPRRCLSSAAAALTGAYAALRCLPAERVSVRSDAEQVLNLTIPAERYGEAPPPWPELLPPAWEREPADFVIEAPFVRPRLRGVVTLRFTSAPRDDLPALAGALRLGWDPASSAAELDADLDAAIQRALAGEGLASLRQRLDAVGDHVGAELGAALEASLGRPATHRGASRVLVDFHAAEARYRALTPQLSGPDRASEASAARSPTRSPTLSALALASDVAARGGRWPALGPDGVEGLLVDGRFVSGGDER